MPTEMSYWRENTAKQQRVFSPSVNNKGLTCPFQAVICQEGYCYQCQVYLDLYLDWQKLGEIVAICARCGKALRREPSRGQPIVSHGI